MSGTPQLVDPGDESEFAFARFVSLLGITPNSAGTFCPDKGASLESAWTDWAERYFSPVLAPAFVSAFRYGMESKSEEIAETDRDLVAQLPDDLAVRSREAGIPFFEGKDEMKANRVWTRYADAVEKGNSPGNLPVVFALQSALFQLPLSSALGSYAWFEFRSRKDGAIQKSAGDGEKAVFSRILPKVTVAVAGKFGDFGKDSGPLRAV